MEFSVLKYYRLTSKDLKCRILKNLVIKTVIQQKAGNKGGKTSEGFKSTLKHLYDLALQVHKKHSL